MKSAVTVLAMGLCVTSAALYAAPPVSSGMVRFRGLIVQDTCVSTVPASLDSGALRKHSTCADMAASGGTAAHGPVYDESMTMIAGHSGVDVLDYHIDNLQGVSVASVHWLTRDYD
ncbi:hypothetical protein [Dyella humicola]|uniref:hypothetical protein n=1 Tax=Dyella humicola TaxID=2992126 RepID=UPI0022555C26|nr:hypothetical protein [Dyella humicola]